MAKEYRVGQRSRDVKVRLCQLAVKEPEKEVKRVLDEGVDADLIVISELQRTTADSLMVALTAQARNHRQYIVLGRGVGTLHAQTANEVGIYTPDGDALRQGKLSLSQWDREQRPPIAPGEELLVHTSGQLRFVVLNCHDYTHASLIHDLIDLDVDLVVVVAANQAAQMFMEYARADAHRLFAYVIVCNVSDVGGSGVYAPFMSRRGRSLEGPAGEMSMGGVQFETRGRARSVVEVDLAIPELRTLRERYRRIDPDDPKSIRSLPSEYKAIAPPESVTYSRPDYRKVVSQARQDATTVRDVKLEDARPASRRGSSTWRIALAQLRSAGMNAYLSTRYVPSRSDSGYLVALDVARRLASAADGEPGNQLAGADLIVFPEVFLPIHAEIRDKRLDDHLREFSNRNGAIVVGGIEYDPDPERRQPGENRVRVYAPDQAPLDYLKLTRSQYDARDPDPASTRPGPPFPIRRGQGLVRFEVGATLSFGVLTCFDFSHLELVHLVNTLRRPVRKVAVADSTDATSAATGPTPLDLMIVPCFNPFGSLYADLARADAHRYYQYVAVCNVAECGESGVFGPEHTSHPRRTLIQAGKDVDTVLVVDLAVGELRNARDVLSDDDIARSRQAPRPDGEQRRTFHRKSGLLTDGERSHTRRPG